MITKPDRTKSFSVNGTTSRFGIFVTARPNISIGLFVLAMLINDAVDFTLALTTLLLFK
jgi:hypothetical protein